MRTVETEVVEGFSRDELILMLSRIRRKFNQSPLSIPTFYRYCDYLSITPKFRYSYEEKRRLSLICIHYAQGGKTSNLPDI